MKKLIALGCSLTSPEKNWAKRLVENLDHVIAGNHIQYAYGGGGNQQLLDCISDYTLKNDLKDLLLVYQITGLNRGGEIVTDEFIKHHKINLDDERKKVAGEFGPDGNWDDFDGVFGKQKLIWTTNYKVIYDSIKLLNKEIMISRVASTLCMLSKAGVDVVTFRGWTGAMPQDYWDKCKSSFDRYGVHYVDTPFVDWCFETNQKFLDEWHPDTEGHNAYAHEILQPFIEERLPWTTRK